VEGIAQLFGIHKNTVRSCLKQGLSAIDDPRRPGDHVQTGRPTHKVFKVRCWRAPRSMPRVNLICNQAVDAWQANAIATGLVAEIGQDRCQQIITEAFRKVR